MINCNENENNNEKNYIDKIHIDPGNRYRHNILIT